VDNLTCQPFKGRLSSYLPLYLKKPIFEKLFDIAEYSKLNKEERSMYDASLKRRWDEYSFPITHPGVH